MPSQTVTTLTLESIDQLRNSLSVRGRSDLTLRAYTSDLKIFLLEMETSSIPVSMIEEMGMMWLQKGRTVLAPKTTGRRLTSLRVFTRWAGLPGALADYSAPTPARPTPHPLPEGMDGVRALVEVATKHHHKALVALCGMVGCRVAESLSGGYADISCRDQMLTIMGKGEKVRIVPVSDEAFEILMPSIIRAGQTGQKFVPLHDRFARTLITQLGVKAGLQRHISSHDLRATFATAVYDRTLNIRLVQELLGHSSVETTQGYTKVKIEAMREAVSL